MITCTIKNHVSETERTALVDSLEKFSQKASECGVTVDISPVDICDSTHYTITINVEDEKILGMKGAKRGPKEKVTKISVDEMLSLKKKGVPSKEIAALAGIGVATYFRRMANVGSIVDKGSCEGFQGGDQS